MFCPQCGTERPPDAGFCPMCGTSFVGGDETPGGRSSRLSLTASFGAAVSSLFTRRAGVALPVVLLAALVGYAVTAVGIVLTVLAGFGTLWPRQIVNTGCFVRSNTPTAYTITRPGKGSEYWRHLPGCDAFRIHPDWTLIAIGAALTIVAYAVATAMAWAISTRAAAYVVDPEYRLWPSIRLLLRTTGRIIGWGLVLWLAFVVAYFVSVFAVVVVASLLPGLVALLLIIAAVIAAFWFGVPLWVRVSLSFILMIVDDLPWHRSWASIVVSTGQAWAFAGLLVVAGIGFIVVSQVTGAIFNLGSGGIVIGIVLTIALYLLETLFFVLYFVIVARGLSSAPPPPAAAVAV